MEKKVDSIYSRAQKEISEKWDAYMKSHEKKVKSAYDDLQEAIKSNDKDKIKEAKDTYERTVKNVTLNNERYKAMVDETTSKMAHTNEVALDYVNGNMAKVYTLGYNDFSNEEITGYTFTLVNEQAIKNIAKEDKSLLPAKKLDIPKDKKWNTKSINSEVLQGILQGESIPKIAKRLSHVTDMNRKSAIRNARTMVTSAENKGRQDSFEKAESDGIVMKRRWVAAIDDRTRAWHSDLDGVEVDIDEAWENDYGSIMYPGDPSADPANVYNCRCSIRAVVKGFKQNKKTLSVLDDSDKAQSYYELKDDAERSGIKHLPVNDLLERLSEQEIINKIGGGDKTQGSCASLTLAYCANKCGLDVTDFRGGKSQIFFSSDSKDVYKIANADIQTYKVKKEAAEVAQIIQKIEHNKEYCLSTGKHVTVIKLTDGKGLQYLELQNEIPGWQPFGNTDERIEKTLNRRFGCRKTVERSPYSGSVFEQTVMLTEVDSVQPTDEFRDILGYLNTATNKQKKGTGGYAK